MLKSFLINLADKVSQIAKTSQYFLISDHDLPERIVPHFDIVWSLVCKIILSSVLRTNMGVGFVHSALSILHFPASIAGIRLVPGVVALKLVGVWPIEVLDDQVWRIYAVVIRSVFSPLFSVKGRAKILR